MIIQNIQCLQSLVNEVIYRNYFCSLNLDAKYLDLQADPSMFRRWIQIYDDYIHILNGVHGPGWFRRWIQIYDDDIHILSGIRSVMIILTYLVEFMG